LRGFSERNLKYMRTFYEEWSPLLEFAYEDSAEASAETAAADAIELRQKLLPNGVRAGLLVHRQRLPSGRPRRPLSPRCMMADTSICRYADSR
jgi:hypothetical protein